MAVDLKGLWRFVSLLQALTYILCVLSNFSVSFLSVQTSHCQYMLPEIFFKNWHLSDSSPPEAVKESHLGAAVADSSSPAFRPAHFRTPLVQAAIFRQNCFVWVTDRKPVFSLCVIISIITSVNMHLPPVFHSDWSHTLWMLSQPLVFLFILLLFSFTTFPQLPFFPQMYRSASLPSSGCRSSVPSFKKLHIWPSGQIYLHLFGSAELSLWLWYIHLNSRRNCKYVRLNMPPVKHTYICIYKNPSTVLLWLYFVTLSDFL